MTHGHQLEKPSTGRLALKPLVLRADADPILLCVFFLKSRSKKKITQPVYFKINKHLNPLSFLYVESILSVHSLVFG